MTPIKSFAPWQTTAGMISGGTAVKKVSHETPWQPWKSAFSDGDRAWGQGPVTRDK